jgi:hypothetical protein
MTAMEIFALSDLVIPGPSQRVRPEVAGPMTSSARSPESITTMREYGFRARGLWPRPGMTMRVRN